MKQWRSLVALHSSAPSCFPQPPAPSPCPSPPREEEKHEEKAAVRLVGSDGRVRTYRRPVTARELMQQHPRHLVCRSDALLIGEKIPAVAPGEELEPGHAYFLLPAHLFHSVLSFVSLASSLLLLLSASTSAAGAGHRGGNGKKQQQRPFELLRTASGTLQIKFSDDFLLADDKVADLAATTNPPVLRGDKKLEKEYEELVGYSKARRWSPKLDTIQEVVVAASDADTTTTTTTTTSTRRSSKGRGLPFLGRLGSRRRRDTPTATTTLVCGNGGAVACSG